MSLFSLLKTGGWIVYPLIILSVVAWIVCLERFLALKGWREKNREFLLSFQNLWLKDDKASALKLCESTDVDLSLLARELIHVNKGEAINDKTFNKLDRKRLELSTDLKKNLWILGTIGSATPFLGLFGTVVGIIKAFQTMAESGAGGFNVVAAGISEALVATAGGILVAVIAVFFYNYFLVKVSQTQFQLNLLTEELMDLFDSGN